MKNITMKLFALTLLSLVAWVPLAKGGEYRDERHHCSYARWCVSAPEIDPAQAGGALVLLSGAVAIVRGYRRRKK